MSALAAVDTAELAEELELLADPPGPGVVRYRVDPSGDGHGLVTVCAADRPGTLARTTGVLALHRVSVLRAHVWSTSAGLALQRFAVQAPATLRWQRLGADLDAAWSGRLAVDARLERKARDYRPAAPVEPDVRVLPDESAHSTVVEVRAGDALGLLHAIAAALGDLDLDVRVAKIDTLGRPGRRHLLRPLPLGGQAERRAGRRADPGHPPPRHPPPRRLTRLLGSGPQAVPEHKERER